MLPGKIVEIPQLLAKGVLIRLGILDEGSRIEISLERFDRHSRILKNERAIGALLELQWNPARLAAIDDVKAVSTAYDAIIKTLEGPGRSFRQARIQGHPSAGPPSDSRL